jgi:uncharacterized membrane protein
MSQNKNSIGMNELVDYQKKNYGKTMDRIMKFLWKCGGADAQILQYAPYADHIKAAGIGGVVLATTFMAMIAMGFAMHTIFGDKTPDGVNHGYWYVTLPVALVWGLIIFNLDRFIVSTVKGDGTEKITWGEWGAMLPRLFMAIIIGLTISAPLETYIFQKEIQRSWNKYQTDLVKLSNSDIEGQIESQKFNNKELVESKNKEKDNLILLVNNQRDRVTRERQSGTGVQWRRDTTALGTMERDLLRLTNELKILQSNDTTLVSKLKYLQDSAKAEIKKMQPGFLDQLMMLEKLSEEGQKVPTLDPSTKKPAVDENGKPIFEPIYGSAFWPIWLVRLLFMIVEIAPVIFKFMIWDSSYDYMKDNVAQILEAKQGISLESFPDEDNKTHRIRKNYNAERIVEVAKRQNELEKENAIHAITLYAEQERKDIEENPDAFVQNQDKTVDSDDLESSPNA